jgi:hypothetical protein
MKETPRLRRPSGTPGVLAAADPTLKCGANLHCAYGAGLTGTHFIHRGQKCRWGTVIKPNLFVPLDCRTGANLIFIYRIWDGVVVCFDPMRDVFDAAAASCSG